MASDSVTRLSWSVPHAATASAAAITAATTRALRAPNPILLNVALQRAYRHARVDAAGAAALPAASAHARSPARATSAPAAPILGPPAASRTTWSARPTSRRSPGASRQGNPHALPAFACEVGWGYSRGSVRTAPPTAPERAQRAFVGRVEELAALRAALADAPRLVVVEGEPGDRQDDARRALPGADGRRARAARERGRAGVRPALRRGRAAARAGPRRRAPSRRRRARCSSGSGMRRPRCSCSTTSSGPIRRR